MGLGKRKTGGDDRTAQGFPDLSAQNAIISDACGGAITLSDQIFVFQPVLGEILILAAGQTRSLYLPCATEDACVLEA